MAKSKIRFLPVLRTSLAALFGHSELLFPFCVIIFVQLLVLEILYFAPRYPLNIFFGPLISKVWGPQYLNYPLNYVLLPELFFRVQMPINIFINFFLIGIATHILMLINDGKRVLFRPVMRAVGPSYIYLMIAAIVATLLTFGFSKILDLLVQRAALIQAQSGWKSNIKSFLHYGAPYIDL